MSASKDPSEFSTNLLEAATFDTREEAEAMLEKLRKQYPHMKIEIEASEVGNA
jgi:hypothetical protein